MPNEPDPPTLSVNDRDVVTAVSHLYRAEMNRMSVWRQRLDVTSNWAVILATALTTFTLGSADVPHYTLLLGLGLVFISILLEGRRYRHLHHSKWRLYLLESGFFANILAPAKQTEPSPDWKRLLAADLRHTHFSISWLTGMRLRLRRNYLLVIGFMSAVWVAKLFMHPTRVKNLAEFYARLHVGEFIPSWLVAATALAFLVTAAVLGLSCPPAEKLEDWSIHYHRRRVQEDEGE
ncbi:MAG: DUF2270 domain-containing protein [Thermoanaerobaculales bacterium]|nr:DUF2270 domain-containing protein [Thermoanaerobaculales bacterium]